MFKQCARNAKALLLPARDIDAALPQVGIQAVRHAVQELIGVSGTAGVPELLLGSVRVAPFQVIPDGAGKQQVLLQHNAYGVAQGGQVVVAHVAAADLDGALGGIVKTGDKLDQCGLGRAGAADNAHRGPGLDVQCDVRQRVFLRRSVILKADIFKVDLPVRHSLHRFGSIGKVGLLSQHFADAAGAGQ